MTFRRPDAFAAVQEHLGPKAERLLLDGNWLLRLSAAPSFSGKMVVGIVHRGREHIAVARHWELQADIDRAAQSVLPPKFPPTVESREQEVSRQFAEDLTASLHRVNVPLMPLQRSITLDGTGYELLIDHIQTTLRVSWNAAPPEWAPLVEWYGSTWKLLVNHVRPVSGNYLNP